MDPAHCKEFAKSQKVIIHTGPFKGREATIVDIKTKQGTEPVYLLSFAHTTFTIVATATALALDVAPLKGSYSALPPPILLKEERNRERKLPCLRKSTGMTAWRADESRHRCAAQPFLFQV